MFTELYQYSGMWKASSYSKGLRNIIRTLDIYGLIVCIYHNTNGIQHINEIIDGLINKYIYTNSTASLAMYMCIHTYIYATVAVD